MVYLYYILCLRYTILVVPFWGLGGGGWAEVLKSCLKLATGKKKNLSVLEKTCTHISVSLLSCVHYHAWKIKSNNHGGMPNVLSFPALLVK